MNLFFKKVKKYILYAINKGIEFRRIELCFTIEGDSIHKIEDITNDLKKLC